MSEARCVEGRVCCASARSGGERVADGYEEEEAAMSEGGEDAAVLGVGGKYAGVQAAGGAVSVEKGVELTSVRAADGGRWVLSAGTR